VRKIMKSLARSRTLIGLLLPNLACTSLAARPKAPPPDPKFLAIDQIVILPVVDARAGKKDNVNLETLRNSAKSDLKSKNYRFSVSDTTGKTGDIVQEDLDDSKPEWIKGLGPSDARWVMVLGLGDVHSKVTFGSSGNAEVFGFLFDKQDGSVLWKGTGVGQAGQGGLLGMAMKGTMSTSAIQTAVANLMVGIPKLPKNK
jgi:hypothetical protein